MDIESAQKYCHVYEKDIGMPGVLKPFCRGGILICHMSLKGLVTSCDNFPRCFKRADGWRRPTAVNVFNAAETCAATDPTHAWTQRQTENCYLLLKTCKTHNRCKLLRTPLTKPIRIKWAAGSQSCGLFRSFALMATGTWQPQQCGNAA